MKPCLKSVIATALLGLAAAAHASPLDTLAGHWEGAYSRLGSVQVVTVDLSVRGGELVGTFSVPECEVWDDSLQVVRTEWPTVVLRPRYGTFTLEYRSADDQLTGVNAGWNPPLALHLKRRPAPARDELPRHDTRFANGGVTLAGTLIRPRRAGRVPAVVLVHGSGDDTRQTRYYRNWGEFFARRGVAAFLYDKRGRGASTGDPRHATFDDLAGDAAAALEAVRRDPRVDPSRVGFVGISQGGWLAPLAASRSPHARFQVLLVGPSVSVAEQELDRVRHEMADDDAPPEAITEAVTYTRRVFDVVGGRGSRAALDSMTHEIRTRPWASHVQIVESEQDLDDWRRSTYDPAGVLRRTTLPTLALFGERDPLVPPANNRDRMAAYLAEAGNRDVAIHVIPGAGHDLVTHGQLRGGKWDWPAAYWVWPRRPAEVATIIESWLRAHGM